MRPLARLTLVSGGLVLLLVGLALFLKYAPTAAVAALGSALVAAFSLTTIATVMVGLAITIVLPPLPKVADTSIFGRRVVGFTRFALATAAVLGTSYVTWMVNRSFDTATNSETFTDAYNQVLEVVFQAVAFAGIVYWWWLSVDLLRITLRRRRNAIDVILRRTDPFLGPFRGFVRAIANALVSTWWWILGAFFIAPVVVLLVITAPQLFGR